MKLKNATIGTRVICKDLSNNSRGYELAESEGQAGVIVGLCVDIEGRGFNSDDVIVRFDEHFNEDLWEDKYIKFAGEFHWGVPVEYLKLEEKSK